MTWLYTQNFDTLNLADLNGQDFWSGDVAADVENTTVLQGTQSVGNAAGVETFMTRTVIATTSGIVHFRIRKSVSNADTHAVGFQDGGSTKASINLNSAGNMVLNGSTTLQTYSANTNYDIDMQYDAATDQSRARVDVGTYSAWTNFHSAGADFDTIYFEKSNAGATAAAYWDDIDDSNAVHGTPVTRMLAPNKLRPRIFGPGLAR